MHALINRERSDREAGFTLIELLVVVAIIGILAAIAIPVFLNQRASARDASVKADLNGIAKVMETVYADQGAYPDGANDQMAAFDAATPVTSPGNAIVIEADATTSSFRISGCNAEGNNQFFYDSSAGGLQTDTVDISETGCDGAVPGDAIDPKFGTVTLPTP